MLIGFGIEAQVFLRYVAGDGMDLAFEESIEAISEPPFEGFEDLGVEYFLPEPFVYGDGRNSGPGFGSNQDVDGCDVGQMAKHPLQKDFPQ